MFQFRHKRGFHINDIYYFGTKTNCINYKDNFEKVQQINKV